MECLFGIVLKMTAQDFCLKSLAEADLLLLKHKLFWKVFNSFKKLV